MKLQSAFLSRAGGRKENEDYCACAEVNGHACYLVADGLGAHRGGAIASKTVGESVISAFKSMPGASKGHLEKYLQYARQELGKRETAERGIVSLKTTLVVLLSDCRSVIWAHIGDSRLYRFNIDSGKLVFRTRDHSVPQRLADSGEIASDQIRFHEDRNRLTAAFQSEGKSSFEYNADPKPLHRGDVFLLCSDGFWEYIFESEMENTLCNASTPESWLAAMEIRLLERAKSDHDNYSALAILVGN
ncbi:MAG TPA: protein phosphatase 2C domain-containing protein [Candidatus Limnocylindrales bacterium]|nr:protein phosphatase 2C domain-containing protein [Candidatus Limnocylindrales bacterium]